MASGGRRPEKRAPADIFYDEKEARKYTNNSRMMEVQSRMSERALELLNLEDDQPCLLLDLGCGSGLSGELLTEHGHVWVGLDISSAMLDVAVERGVEGDVLLCDLGQGLNFRPGTFHGAISISALQWLCNADCATHNPQRRLRTLFTTLYSCLERGARAVFQLYPENAQQMEVITAQAARCGFTGGVVIDYPHSSSAKKIFLCLFSGSQSVLPKALGCESESDQRSQAQFTNHRLRAKAARGSSIKKSRDWILEKKERRRRQGKEVKCDSKYTGRKRRPKF
ncbi:18S rRNA (guanine-N(7))-methyltransferase [Lampetra fluviatilis]